MVIAGGKNFEDYCPGLSEATFYTGSESTYATVGKNQWPLDNQ